MSQSNTPPPVVLKTPDVHSPDMLHEGTTNMADNKRLNRAPVFIGAAFMMIVILVLGYSLMKRSDDNASSGPGGLSPALLPVPASAPDLGQKTKEGSTQSPSSGNPTSNPQTLPSDASPNTPNPLAANAATAASWQAYTQANMALAQQRQEALAQALDASTTVQVPAPPASNTSPTLQGMPSVAGAPASPVTVPTPDPNKQIQKQAWLNQSPETADYLNHGRQAPISPYELKAGSIIPSVMISGINSDLPGQLIAQVRENVYDSATGQYLLLPQGSRLIGTYDNGVTMGQSRVLVAWSRVIYPDGSSLDLGLMPGSDASGYAGFNDKTNNHYARIFGSALMLSVFSAGIQLSQPQSNSVNGNYSSSQIIAASLGQQLGDLGMEVTRRNLDIAPTIEIRPGYQFNVMITKDIILKPWQGN